MNCQNMLTNVMGPSGRFRLSKVEFYAPRLRCEFNFQKISDEIIGWNTALKRVKDGAEEDVWKRRDFGNNLPLMRHTKSNGFLKISVRTVRSCQFHLRYCKFAFFPLIAEAGRQSHDQIQRASD